MSDSTKTLKWKRLALHNLFSKQENFETFCRFCLPNAFTKPFAQFHHDIKKDFDKEGNSAVGAPRGHGKSTEIGQGYVMHKILYKLKKYIVYTSQNHEKSIEFLEPIRYEIKNNKIIKFIYGDLTAKSINDDDGKDREDMFDVGGVRIRALSFEKNIRGLKFMNQRPDLIILDDIEDDQRVLNPDLRRKDGNKLNKQIIPSLDIDFGEIKMVGTILHHDSLLVKKIRLFDGKIYRACEFDSDDNIIPSSILFPAMFTVERLLKKRHDMGSSSFQSEYLNDPVDDSSSLIKREWVSQCFDENLSFGDTKEGTKYLGVDFAFSDRVSADKSAFLSVHKKEKYVINGCITRKGMSITEQFEYIQELHDTNKYKDCALEENSIRSMSKELKHYTFPTTLFWTGASDPASKRTYDVDFKNKRYTVGKTQMINRLATQFENNNVVIPYKTREDKEIAQRILSELTTYALNDGKLVEVGVHGDIPIALGYAIERAEKDGGAIIDF